MCDFPRKKEKEKITKGGRTANVSGVCSVGKLPQFVRGRCHGLCNDFTEKQHMRIWKLAITHGGPKTVSAILRIIAVRDDEVWTSDDRGV